MNFPRRRMKLRRSTILSFVLGPFRSVRDRVEGQQPRLVRKTRSASLRRRQDLNSTHERSERFGGYSFDDGDANMDHY